MEKVWIDVLGIRILEPATLFTDLLITIGCLIFSYRLNKLNSDNKMHRYWYMFFLVLGVSTVIGGISHGFFHYFGSSLSIAAWITSGVATYFAELSSVSIISNNRLRKILAPLIAIKLIVFILSAIYFQKFVVVKINGAIGLIAIVFITQLVLFIKEKDKGSRLILFGIIIALMSSFTHSLGLSINKWFNHNDISHLIIVISLYFVFLGSSKTKLNISQKTELNNRKL